jgi:hypothetical protein
VQIKWIVTELPAEDYFGLHASSLAAKRQPGAAQVLWTSLPDTDLRVALMVAPSAYAWGMQFRHRKALHDALEASLGNDHFVRSMVGGLEQHGIALEAVPSSLLGCAVLGTEEQYEVGGQVADLSHAVVRTELVPDDEQEFQRFLAGLDAHILQLGRFFLLPVPERVDVAEWEEAEDARLTRLFYRPSHGRKKGEQMDCHLRDIRLALETLDGAEAQEWLTPRFLEWEQIRPAYPLPADASISGRALAFFDSLNLRPMGELLDDKKTRSLLQLELIRKWQWPLGLRYLDNGQSSAELRKTMLGNNKPWTPAEELVSEILTEGKQKYPVLFE